MFELDNTKRSDFVTCPRKFQRKWLLNQSPEYGSTPLRYGIAWHACMEGFYNVIADKGWSALKEAMTEGARMGQESFLKESKDKPFYDDYRSLENMMKSFINYIDHFYGDEGLLEVTESEKVFKIKMTPTEFEQEVFPGIDSLYFTGRIDNVVKLNLRPWLLEHKTTGQHLSVQSQRLQRSPQVIGYNYAARAVSKEIPDGSLIVLHHLSAYKSKVSGEYGNPKIDFQRVPHIFSIEDLVNWRLGFMSDAWRLQQCYDNDFFPMSHYSCYTYGKCTYINLCEQNRTFDKEILHGFYIDEDPWDTLKGAEDKLVTVSEEPDFWQDAEVKLLN